MDSFDYCIVGSGAAGTHAAWGLRGCKVLLLDCGQSPRPWVNQPLADVRLKNGHVIPETIGENFESLINLTDPYLSPKLKAPFSNYVVSRPDNTPANPMAFLSSYAEGGLANSWGGGVYRFDDLELKDFPYRAAELKTYYDLLSNLVGIQGVEDDLQEVFGKEPELMEPLPATRLGQYLFDKYRRKRSRLIKKGVRIGYPRLALLTKEHNGRLPYGFFEDDFFAPRLQGLYSPAYTLQSMRNLPNFHYEPGFLVESYHKSSDGMITVLAKKIQNTKYFEFKCRKLLLGAGALNTTKIVLRSNNDYETKAPLLENSVSFIPTFNPRFLGSPLESKARIGGEAVISIKSSDQRDIFVAFYGLRGPLKADLWGDLPLSSSGRVWAMRNLLQSLAVLQVFHEGKVSKANFAKLSKEGRIEIEYSDPYFDLKIEKIACQVAFSLGFFTSRRLIKRPPPGSSIHYAGCLPMTNTENQKYRTDHLGELSINPDVHIIDSSAFPSLPSKNLTFTIMAHALRIGTLLKEEAS